MKEMMKNEGNDEKWRKLKVSTMTTLLFAIVVKKLVYISCFSFQFIEFINQTYLSRNICQDQQFFGSQWRHWFQTRWFHYKRNCTKFQAYIRIHGQCTILTPFGKPDFFPWRQKFLCLLVLDELVVVLFG